MLVCTTPPTVLKDPVMIIRPSGSATVVLTLVPPTPTGPTASSGRSRSPGNDVTTVATCTAAPLLPKVSVTTADRGPMLRPETLVTVRRVAVAAVTVPLPAGENITVLLPGVVASKLLPVM